MSESIVEKCGSKNCCSAWFEITPLTWRGHIISILRKMLKLFAIKHLSFKSNKKTTLQWVHVTISNAKRNLLGVYHMIKMDYLQNYLDEFCYRLNRRYFDERLFDPGQTHLNFIILFCHVCYLRCCYAVFKNTRQNE